MQYRKSKTKITIDVTLDCLEDDEFGHAPIMIDEKIKEVFFNGDNTDAAEDTTLQKQNLPTVHEAIDTITLFTDL